MDVRSTIDKRYSLMGLIGSGGMGDVYLARDEKLGRDVALKILKEPYASEEESRKRFKREAASAARLNHPNIVAVYDREETPEENGAPYIVMEHVPGETLAQRIKREGPLEPAEVARIGAAVARALEAAHQSGIVHRDIKPHNVFLTAQGDVKVGDFGIARTVSAASSASEEATAVLGTARYVSPEQAREEPALFASDLYSLGIVLYEMLTGRVPFEADSAVAIALKHVTEKPLSLQEADPGVRIKKDLEAITLGLLHKDPKERYLDAAGLISDLQRTRQGLEAPAGAEEAATEAIPKASSGPAGGMAPTEAPASRVVRRRRSRLLSLPVAAGLLLALLVPTGYALSDRDALLTRLEQAAGRAWGDPQAASQGASQSSPSPVDEAGSVPRASSSSPGPSDTPASAREQAAATPTTAGTGASPTDAAPSQGSSVTPDASAGPGSSPAVTPQDATFTAAPTTSFTSSSTTGGVSAPETPPAASSSVPYAPETGVGQPAKETAPAAGPQPVGAPAKGTESASPSPASASPAPSGVSSPTPSAVPEGPVTRGPGAASSSTSGAASSSTSGAGVPASGVHASKKSTSGQNQLVQQTNYSGSQ